MPVHSKRYTIAILLTILLAGSLAFTQVNDLFFQIKKQLTIFSDAYKEVATLYVEDVSPERLMTTGLNAMLNELDPYTVFIPEGEQQQMEILSSGSYGGIGIDAGYRGEVGVIAFNSSEDCLTFNRGDRIAQMVIQKLPEIELVQTENLDASVRGEGGFGSTGHN